MSIVHPRWSLAAVLFGGLLTVLPTGCAVTGVGYDGGYGYGGDYYEPYGIDYGGWGVGYNVGPYRGGGRRFEGGGGRPGGHAYRSAPASHAMPSIPSHGRSGGGHSGGGRGGGGHR